MNNDDLMVQALHLPRADRLKLVEDLIDGLADDVSQDEWDRAWGEEINRRLARIRDGERCVPLADVMAELERRSERKAS